MIKKILIVLLSIVLCISITACVQKNNTPTEPKAHAVCDGIEIDPKYNGLYNITGYISAGMGDTWACTLSVSGIDCDNKGEIDAAKLGLPHIITSIYEYVYVDLKFTNDNLSCDVVDKKTFQSILSKNNEELLTSLFQECTYPKSDAGNLPDNEISLSQFGPGKIHVFSSDNIWKTPTFINDSDEDILVVSVINTNWELQGRIFVPSKSVGTIDNDMIVDLIDGKLYIAVGVGTFDDILNSDESTSLKSQNLNVGYTLDRGTSDIICNDTSQTIILIIDNSTEITLAPNECALIPWILSATIKEIK